jgi:ATPase family associated with various cellular activities (AAA)
MSTLTRPSPASPNPTVAPQQRDARSAETDVNAAYANSMEHILAELERIDLLIQVQVRRARRFHQENEFQGLYISELEVDTLLAKPIGMPSWAFDKSADAEGNCFALLETLHAHIKKRKDASLAQNVPLRLTKLGELFQLVAFDLDVILVCLAGELDLRYERLYAYLQDDVTRKRPSVDLLLNLLCTNFEDKLQARTRFSTNSPLLRHILISLQEDPANPRTSLLNRSVKLDDRIVNYLLGSDEIDSRLSRLVSAVDVTDTAENLLAPAGLLERLQLLVENQRREGSGLNLYFQGPYGIGKRSTAASLCDRAGLQLLFVNTEQVASSDSDFAATAELITREAALNKSAVYWHGFDALLSADHRNRLTHLLRVLEAQEGIVFFAGETVWEPSDTPNLSTFVRIEFPSPAYADRLRCWKLAVNDVTAADLDAPALANKFHFTGGQIGDAARTARNLARRRDPQGKSLIMADLLEACRLQSNRKLATLASRIQPHYSWPDIVLPPDKLRELREICNAVEFRSIVHDEWGFGNKLSLGKGLGILFAGPSGTGKTMAAEILAGELGLDLYKIDLSTVISKYIGETEKNLSRIFTEAATSNAILFFDEADALFGKRSEVRDSHDRYANIEINYLLQRMEEYEGTVILATNLRKNMDDAFVRRIQFTIEFPFPQADQRLAIWQRVWPKNMPRRALDLDFMANRFELSGGNIRNIALSAAFLAAEGGGAVEMKHLIRSTWQEYQKMGKVVMEGEFGEYEHLSHAVL